MTITIQKMYEEDLPEVIELLTLNDLPTDDLVGGKVLFFGIKKESKLVACIGLEKCKDVGLLRSLVVDDAFRSQGLARALVDCLETEAKMIGYRSLYLLTISAGTFFKKLGYKLTQKDTVPKAIKLSKQYSVLCPDSADILFKRI